MVGTKDACLSETYTRTISTDDESQESRPVRNFTDGEPDGPPSELIAARDALEKCDGDALGSNTAAQYRTIMEVLSDCREMLDAIEAYTIERVGIERRYHQARVDDINTLGDLPEPRNEPEPVDAVG